MGALDEAEYICLTVLLDFEKTVIKSSLESLAKNTGISGVYKKCYENIK